MKGLGLGLAQDLPGIDFLGLDPSLVRTKWPFL